MYMGDSLGEGYFGGMEDLLGGGHSDEGEEFRKSLAHLQNTKFAGDAEGRGEKNADTERIESRSDQDIELRGTDERIGEPNKMEPGIILILSPILTSERGRNGSFPTPEDQGLILDTNAFFSNPLSPLRSLL
jgi:hypothetical protein